MLCYTIAIIFSLILSRYTSANKINNRLIVFFVCVSWWLLLSLQYNVGTDYFSYISIFSDEKVASLYYDKKEVLFAFIATLISKNNYNPQVGFFIVYAILFLGLFLFITKSDLDNFVGFYVLLCCSSFLYNATNGIRQYTAIPYICLATIFFCDKEYKKTILCLVIPSLFHNSTLLCIPMILVFCFLVKIIRNRKFYVAILFLSLLFAFKSPIHFIEPIIMSTRYSHYLKSDSIIENLGIVNLLTKFIFFPIYFAVLFIKIDSKYERYIHLGIFAYSLKLFLVQMSIFRRIGDSFEFLSLLPLVYYYKYNHLNKNLKFFLLLYYICAGICLVLLKIFYASINGFPEYAYKSILSI